MAVPRISQVLGARDSSMHSVQKLPGEEISTVGAAHGQACCAPPPRCYTWPSRSFGNLLFQAPFAGRRQHSAYDTSLSIALTQASIHRAPPFLPHGHEGENHE